MCIIMSSCYSVFAEIDENWNFCLFSLQWEDQMTQEPFACQNKHGFIGVDKED